MCNRRDHSCHRKGIPAPKPLRPKPRIQTVLWEAWGRQTASLENGRTASGCCRNLMIFPLPRPESRNWLVQQSLASSLRGISLLLKTPLSEQPSSYYLSTVVAADQDESYWRLRRAWISKPAGHTGLTWLPRDEIEPASLQRGNP